jgi:hypothetical protein
MQLKEDSNLKIQNNNSIKVTDMEEDIKRDLEQFQSGRPGSNRVQATHT